MYSPILVFSTSFPGPQKHLPSPNLFREWHQHLPIMSFSFPITSFSQRCLPPLLPLFNIMSSTFPILDVKYWKWLLINITPIYGTIINLFREHWWDVINVPITLLPPIAFVLFSHHIILLLPPPSPPTTVQHSELDIFFKILNVYK